MYRVQSLYSLNLQVNQDCDAHPHGQKVGLDDPVLLSIRYAALSRDPAASFLLRKLCSYGSKSCSKVCCSIPTKQQLASKA